MKARLLACFAAAALACFGCGGGAPVPRNVVLVTLDTTRADYLGCYGHAGGLTPNLDALAAQGVRFDDALSTSALTPVSHASIMTGLLPYEHGVRVMVADGGYELDAEIPSLATVLSARGLRTGAIQSGFPVSSFFGFDRGFDVFDECGADFRRVAGEAGLSWGVGKGQRRADRTTERALEFLGESADPFFLWVHYWDPHDDVVLPPEEYWNESIPRDASGRPRKSPELYAAELAFVDAQFGRLMAELERSGVAEDTLVVVIADHGEGLDDGVSRHGWYGHRIVYQEQLRVPLIVRVPGGPQGRVVAEQVGCADVYPTVLDLLDVPMPREVTGASLRAQMEGAKVDPRTLYAEAVHRFDLNAHVVTEKRPQDALVHCVSDGRYKLLFRPEAPSRSELFDLRADPGEIDDLYGREPAIVQRLLVDLALRRPWLLEPLRFEGGGVSETALEILAGLGYTGGEAGGADRGSSFEWLCPETGERFPTGPDGAGCSTPLVPVRSD